MVALHKLAEQVELYKTNLNGGHFTLKRTITDIAQSSEINVIIRTDINGGTPHKLAEQIEHYKTNLNAGHYINFKTNHHI